MTDNKVQNIKTSFIQKFLLALLGIFLSFIIIEVTLRLGGAIFLSLQEFRNNISLSRHGRFRILCMGESTTAMGAGDSYPSQLEEILNQCNIGINFSVINKGVPSITSSYIVSHLQENIEKYKPHMVVVMMGINDDDISYPSYQKRNSSMFERLSSSLRIYKLTKLLKAQTLANKTKAQNENIGTGGKEEAELKKGIEAHPTKVENYLLLGAYYKKSARFQDAYETFKKVALLFPENEAVLFELGYYQRYFGRYSEAEKTFKRVTELNPKNGWPYLQLGYCYSEQNMPKETEEAFKKAAQINPENKWPHLELGLYYLEQNVFYKAEEEFKKVLEIEPFDERAWGGLADLYRQMDQSEASKECYRRQKEIRSQVYNILTRENYLRLKEILDNKSIKLVCVQYPMRSVEQLKKFFPTTKGIIFVDNEEVFKTALGKDSYREYFINMFAGDFGHCTRKGNRILAKNIADTILKEYFKNNVAIHFNN